MKTALTIAGSDSSGGAGIQADIKTMTANGVYAMSAITALTAQNTTGVTGIFEATPEFLAQEIDAIFTDIYPDAVKIGMVSSAELIGVIAEKLHTYGAKHIVVVDHLALLALTPDILLQNHFHGIIPPYSSKYLSMARSSVVFASATVMPEHWPPAVVELPPPPSVSTSTCTLISPRERAEM